MWSYFATHHRVTLFFFETEAKDLPQSIIKKKRIAQLINKKPGKNRYSKTTREQHLKPATSKPTWTLNLQQRAHNTWSTTTQRSVKLHALANATKSC
jgi:hypothetical protein